MLLNSCRFQNQAKLKIVFLPQLKEKLPPSDSGRSSPIFVFGYEAERQRNDIKQFGHEVASKLAERRAEYAKRQMALLREESVIIEVSITKHLSMFLPLVYIWKKNLYFDLG